MTPYWPAGMFHAASLLLGYDEFYEVDGKTLMLYKYTG